MSKVVILGAEGNLGNCLFREFSQKKEYNVIGWDKQDIDITDQELVMEKLTEIAPDIIINTAAYNAVDQCEEDEKEEEKAKMINSRAVEFLAEAALKTGSILVHFSSDYVFKGEKEDGYTEEDKPEPVNKYGKTKRMGEEEIISRSGEGLKWYLIRTSKLFGPVGTGEDTKKSFFDKILELSEERKEFKMVHGEEISCFTYIPDLAAQVRELIENKKPYGIYHITNSGAASWYDGAQELFRLHPDREVKLIPVSSEEFDRPAQRPRNSVLVNTKIESLRSWQEALREYYNS